MYDLIILGAGSAGMTAGIYAGRKKLKTLIISPNIGGQMTWTNVIENYPGIDQITNGAQFAISLKKQVAKFGVEFVTDKVIEIKKDKENFVLKGESKNYNSKTVIIAIGLEHRRLGVPGEVEFTGRGVTYCSVCDGPMFAGKTVAVIGSGNCGLQAAEFLLKICPEVYLLEIKDDFQGDKVLVEHIKNNPRLKFLPHHTVKGFKGEKFLNQIVVENNSSVKELDAQGVFIEIGYKPNTDWLKSLIELNQRGEIIIDANCQTNTPGIFAAGDTTGVKYKQIIIAEGAGAIAALAANDYLLQNDKL